MKTTIAAQFDQADVLESIETLDAPQLDALNFGVIGFDREGLVRRYNEHESRLAGLSRELVVGTPLFTAVAPCMNNFLVAQRFEDAADQATRLDDVIDYVFTLRMRPAKVKLRLLFVPHVPLRYVLVWRPL